MLNASNAGKRFPSKMVLLKQKNSALVNVLIRRLKVFAGLSGLRSSAQIAAVYLRSRYYPRKVLALSTAQRLVGSNMNQRQLKQYLARNVESLLSREYPKKEFTALAIASIRDKPRLLLVKTLEGIFTESVWMGIASTSLDL